MKKKFLILIVFLLTILIFQNIKLEKNDNSIQNVKSTNSNKNITSRVDDYGIPISISIPKLKISADVESVGQDEKGNMDIPKITDNVAWYNLGYIPGEKGNTVFAGHYDTKTGQPAVFWDLEKLTSDDEIIVNFENGYSLRFKVTHKATFPYDNFPIKEVFGDSDKSRINLITCGGSWDEISEVYSDRIVVFSEIIEE